jgi:hypothetical protein
MEPNDEEFKKILEKIAVDKEERQKGLEELRRRKKEIERKGGFEGSPHFRDGVSGKVRQTLSTDRKEYNKKVYEHLQSPNNKEPKQMKPRHLNRFEELEAERVNKAHASQVNRLKMIDKRTRYANIVKEIFSPTIDMQKRQEVENRLAGTTKTRSAYNSRGNSVEPAESGMISPTYSQSNLRSPKALQSAGRSALDSPRVYS